MRGSLENLVADKRGIAVVEFALLSPVLLIMLLATIEFARAINVNRDFNLASEMVGDLVAREEYMGTSTSDALNNLNGMMLSIGQVMQPYSITPLKLGVISVRASPSDATNTWVDWAYSYNGQTVPARCAKFTLPTGLVGAGGSTIVVQSSYVYTPLFAGFAPGIPSNLTWTSVNYHSPRINSCVDYVESTTGACLSTC